tara:strand:- start:26286 stop:26432 length:147 start_codon:yes stop_codon:yes gene_type:complete
MIDSKKENKKLDDKPKLHYELDELLAKIAPENRHKETDWGPPVGKEVW